MQTDPEEQEMEHLRTSMEALMFGLNPNVSHECHKQYMAGFIDCLSELNYISDEKREKLYTEYCF